MVEPLMQSPLHVFGLDAMATPINDSKGAWVHEIPFLGYISLRGNSSDALFMNAATSALGVVPPTEPCTFAEASDNKVL